MAIHMTTSPALNPDTAMKPLPTDIDFSDEQAMLQEAAAAFCRDRSPTRAVRARLHSPAESAPPAEAAAADLAIWQDMVELGWAGVCVPEAHGGSGLAMGHLAVLAEPMGRHLMATPFAGHQCTVQALLAGADQPTQACWLPRLAQGAIATLALWDDEGDWRLGHGSAGARIQGATAHLHGRKTLVLHAAQADLFLVAVQRDGQPALALLPAADLPASHHQPETVIDHTQRSSAITLDGLQLPASALITGAPAQAALRALQRTAWLLAAAEAAGGIAGVLAVVVDYLNTRSAFGRKIGSYQGLKHPCADILVGLERARSHVHHAATLANQMSGIADDGPAGQAADIALRMAKLEACDSLAFAGDRAVQFHGGFGFTWDCDAQLYLRRALWLQPWFGDAAHHRAWLADALFGVAA